MTDKELAQLFVEHFDKFSDDEKSNCLDNIFDILVNKYDINLGVCLENKSNTMLDEYFIVPFLNTKVAFCWNEDTSNIKWYVPNVNHKLLSGDNMNDKELLDKLLNLIDLSYMKAIAIRNNYDEDSLDYQNLDYIVDKLGTALDYYGD